MVWLPDTASVSSSKCIYLWYNNNYWKIYKASHFCSALTSGSPHNFSMLKAAQYHPGEGGEKDFHTGQARRVKWSVQEDKEAFASGAKPCLCLTGLIHPLVTTSLPILPAKNFSSVVCQYPLPEESLKHRVLKSAATAYFVSVKTNFSKKTKPKQKPILCFVLYMTRFLRERAFLDPQEVKASLRWRAAEETFDL